MLRYVFRRLLISIPTLLIISMSVFGISKCAPGDPVVNIFGEETLEIMDPEREASIYQRRAAQLGLDKPLFYWSIDVAAFPDTLWKIYPPGRRQKLWNITAQNGNWAATRAYEDALNRCIRQLRKLPDSIKQKPYLNNVLLELSNQNNLERISLRWQQAAPYFDSIAPALRSESADLSAKTYAVCHHTLPARLYQPAFHWYGLNNQYHHWLTGFLSGNWGLTKRQVPLWEALRPAFFATMALNAIALFFAYLIAIPLGVEMARRKYKKFDQWSQGLLLFLKAMPVFWMGSLLIILFCSPIFGKALIANPYLDITDAWNENSQSFFSWLSQKLPKFVLPIIVLTLYSLAIIALQMRGGMLESLKQDYIRTAWAKGLSGEAVHWTHAFRNALFPVITIFAAVFPALFTGSLVIETLFNFPGMGQQAQSAFLSHDVTVLSLILMIAAVLSIFGNLVADMMYAWVDPRVRYSR